MPKIVLIILKNNKYIVYTLFYFTNNLKAMLYKKLKFVYHFKNFQLRYYYNTYA